jgi:hypothetical protein
VRVLFSLAKFRCAQLPVSARDLFLQAENQALAVHHCDGAMRWVGVYANLFVPALPIRELPLP